MAAVTAAVGNGTTSGLTSYPTAAFTPAVGDLLVVAYGISGYAANDWTLTDSQGGTYTQIGTGATKNAADVLRVYVRDSLVPAAVATTVTLSHASGTGTGATWHVYRVSGMANTGAAAVLQSDTDNAIASGATPSHVFGSNTQTGNPTICTLYMTSGTLTIPAPTGWAASALNGTHSTPNQGQRQAHRDSGFVGTTITWGGTVPAVSSSIALELDAGGTPPPPAAVRNLASLGVGT